MPETKSVSIALTRIYGIGRKNVIKVLADAKIDSSKKAKDLTSDEVSKISKVLESFKVEGDLRKEISENIKRLKEIGSYRGIRHSRSLPTRGQRTRTNARTKRGKRVTIGALRKEAISASAAPAAKEKASK